MNYKNIKQTLICDLTDKERQDYGLPLATALGDREDIETEKKKHADHFKDRIAGLQAKADELSRKVRDGKEWRDVDCRVFYGQPDKQHKQTIRLDTGEVVKTDRMTDSDLQLVMPEMEGQDDAETGDEDAIEVDAEEVALKGLPMPDDDGGIEPEVGEEY